MNRLQRFALRDGPLQLFNALSEVHVREVQVYQTGVVLNQPDQVRDEVLRVFAVLVGQWVAAQIQRLNLRVVFGNREHNITELLGQEPLVR